LKKIQLLSQSEFPTKQPSMNFPLGSGVESRGLREKEQGKVKGIKEREEAEEEEEREE
jgi:hypothetical protein